MPHNSHLISKDRNKRFFSCTWGLSSIILIQSKFWLSQSHIQHQSTAVVWWATRYTCQSQESLHDFLMSEEYRFKYQLKREMPWDHPWLCSLSSLCKEVMLSVAAKMRSNWKMTQALASLASLMFVSWPDTRVDSASITLVNKILLSTSGCSSNLVVTSQHVNKDIADDAMYTEKLMAK